MSTKEKEPRIILKDGRPEAVILDIEEYQEMLERLEDFLEEKLVKVMRIRHRREVYR
jgi:PHD/YefM family antitoxin component YafN of YafNO toxin-antitoxin module